MYVSFEPRLPPISSPDSTQVIFRAPRCPALVCAHAAYRKGLKTGEAVSLELRDALFERGLNIARPDVLADIAEAFGVDPYDETDSEAVRQDWRDGIRRGVKGSPHFYCGNIEAFCPSLDIARDGTGELVVTNNLAVLNTFLAHCLEG